MIPGVGETLRVIGKGRVVVDPNLCRQFSIRSKAPRSVLVVDIQEVYFQCQKAIARSKLWDDDNKPDKGAVPSAGEVLASFNVGFDAEDYDRHFPERMRETIY